jgi:hypothetical protein
VVQPNSRLGHAIDHFLPACRQAWDQNMGPLGRQRKPVQKKSSMVFVKNAWEISTCMFMAAIKMSRNIHRSFFVFQ